LASILSNSTGVSDLLGENDKTNKTEGDASFWLKLTASNASPVLIIPLKDIALQGIRANEEFFSLDIYLPDISKINNIQLLYAENATNYVIDAQNLNADYSPRKNGWNTLKFRKKDVLNFSYQNLTSVKIKITFQSMAVGQTYELNLDNFREQLPDYLQVVYYTNFKGKNSAGNFVSKLENESDVPLFEKIAPDLLLPIVLRAAFYLAPQLKTNTDFTTIFFQEAENTIINLGRSYPRKRIINYGKLEFSLE
jgi:dynactin complex subunit